MNNIFKNENIGFFYRELDSSYFWIMAKNEKQRMNDSDKKLFNEIRPKLLKINEKKDLYFEDWDNYYGFGWSHNLKKLGIWSEGQISTLFFRTEKNYGDIKLEIFCKPYITEKNQILEFDIYINNTFNQNVKLTANNQEEKIEILVIFGPYILYILNYRVKHFINTNILMELRQMDRNGLMILFLREYILIKIFKI